MLRIIALLLAAVALAHGTIISVGPQNAVVQAGSDARLNCTISDEGEEKKVSWREHVSSPAGQLIFRNDMTGPNDPDDYAIMGKYDLIVKSADVQDGGRYSCALTDEEPMYVHLIVAEEPVIVQNMVDFVEGRDYNLGCNLQYGAPTYEIEDKYLPTLGASIYNRIVAEPLVSKSEGDVGVVASSISIRFNFTALPELHDKFVNCTMSIEDPPTTISTSTQLKIFHVTSSAAIVKPQLKYRVGDRIRCEGNGYPAPTYKWSAIKTASNDEEEEGDELRVTESMLGMNQWRCEATNVVEEQEASATATVDFTAVEDSSNSAPALMNAPVVLVTWLLAAAYSLM